MTVPAAGLAGRRVLVLEDEMLIALMLENTLIDHGCDIVGPFSTLGSGLAAARAEPLDLAVLDVNVAGEKAYPVAEVLSARRIPFLLLSGYGQTAVPADRPEWKVCGKPFRERDLVAMLRSLLT